MNYQKRWIFVLILVNIFLLYVMYIVIQQWNNVSVASIGRDPLLDSFSNQKLNHWASDRIRGIPINDKGSFVDDYLNIKSAAVAKRNTVLQHIAQKHPDKCINNCDDHDGMYRRPVYDFFKSDFVINETLLAAFKDNRTFENCNGKIKIHNKQFAILHHVVLHQKKWQATGLIKAGKKLYTFKDHALRTDEAEVLRPKYGLLDIVCSDTHAIKFDNKTLENVLMLKYLIINKAKTIHDTLVIENDFTVAIEREDYANFYHVMLHIHSIFTMLMVFHKQPNNISILILDAHPQAEVDEMFETLYGPLIRVTELNRNVKFKNLVLSLKEGNNILSKYWINSQPHLEEFRKFVFNQYLLHENHFLNCRKLTITFIWRRDKIWHPRNLKGSTQRKIFNEAELYNAIYNKYPTVCINGLLLESVPMKEQLKFIRKTDILIGMHGAGLTHSLFLPKTSGLIELFPMMFRKTFHYYKLFEVIAKRRNLHYLTWENTRSDHEMPNYFTRVDPVELIDLVDKMIKTICNDTGQYF